LDIAVLVQNGGPVANEDVVWYGAHFTHDVTVHNVPRHVS
jgi:hypothetical protein